MPSSMYRTIETETMVSRINEAVAAKGLTTFPRTTQLSGGRTCTEFVFDQLYTEDLGGITPVMKFYNSYNGKSSARFVVGFRRKVCSNGMTIGENIFKERIIHIHGAATEAAIEQVPAKVAAAIEYLRKELMPYLKTLASTPVTEGQMVNIVEGLKIPKTVREATLLSIRDGNVRPTYDQDNTLFSLFNITNELLRRSKRTTANSQDKYNKTLLKDIVELLEVA